MIEISIDYINDKLIVYGIVALFLYLGMKLNLSWINVKKKIIRKKFFFRWMICLFLDITVYLILVFSSLFETRNVLVYEFMRNIGAILIIFYEVLAISSIIQRCRCMIHSKFFMIIMMSVWIFNDFLRILVNPKLLMIILVIGMIPDKDNSKEEYQE